MARRLYRSEPAALGALELCAARERTGASPTLYPRSGPTAVLTHGANPGLVSHFVKQALIDSRETPTRRSQTPTDRADWARLAERLGVKVIHIAERDTQVSAIPKEPGEFVNTWSIDGFFSEGSQPAELGWGTHERHFPADGRRHDFGSQAAIYLLRPAPATRVRSWTPLEGPYLGFLITHGESISIADYLTVRRRRHGPLPADLPLRLSPVRRCGAEPARAGRQELARAEPKRLMMDEITKGIDELGVLLMGPHRASIGTARACRSRRRAGRRRTTTRPRCRSPRAVLAGVIWAIEHPRRGIVEPEDLDFARMLDICRPYLGDVVGVYGDWTPLLDRERLFPEDLDRDDPWQFKNFRVVFKAACPRFPLSFPRSSCPETSTLRASLHRWPGQALP